MGERITLQNLIELFIEKSNLPKNEVDFFVRSFFVLIEKGLAKDGYVKIKGLGSFKLVKVEDRESVNVNTGERFLIEGHTKISFVPDGGLRELINKPFGHFETVILNDGVEFDDLLFEEEEVTEIVEEKIEPEHKREMVETTEFPEEEAELSQAKQEEPVSKKEEKSTPLIEETPENISAIEEPGFIEENKKEEGWKVGSDSAKVEPTEKKRSAWILPVILILIGGIVALFFFLDLNFGVAKSPVSLEIAAHSEVIPEPESFIAGKDTLVAEVMDSVILEQEQIEEEIMAEVVPAPVIIEKEPPLKTNPENKMYTDNKKYTISGTKATHTVKQGERLTVIALQYYGTKKLWPYIVEHNKGVITNPDVVPYGTVIKIPELK